jgi:acetyl-CoA carboxylase carboxyl transferase subunit alpha
LVSLYGDLTVAQCQIARHADRHCKDYIEALFTQYTPLAGIRTLLMTTRSWADWRALDGRPVRLAMKRATTPNPALSVILHGATRGLP